MNILESSSTGLKKCYSNVSLKYIKRESYMHKKAKEVLKEWFDNSQIAPICFSPNRKSGVWLEYPICLVDGSSSWDFNWDELVADDEGYVFGNEYVPTYEECITKYNTIPIAIIDLVCTHKGHPIYAIEICHKHPTPKDKIEKLKDFGVNHLIEIDAQWILSQIEPPKTLKYKTLIDLH